MQCKKVLLKATYNLKIIFTDWLVKVSNDDARAYCRFCAIVLRAHKSDLTSHATTAKHIKNVSTSTNAPSGPISVQIIVDDNQLQSTPTNSSLNGGFGSGGSRASMSTPPRIQYPKKYRVEWEDMEEFKGKYIYLKFLTYKN